MVLEIFSQGECDRVVVVSEHQHPIGVMNLRRIVPYWITSLGLSGGSLDVQKPLNELGLDFVEPIVTVPAQMSVEQFGAYLRQADTTDTVFNQALVDPDGKFLGLLDTSRLLQYLAESSHWAMDTNRGKRAEQPGIDSLVQLFEKLPWPVILQTTSGEILTQNSAWLQNFGALSDPEWVRQEVEAILENSSVLQVEDTNHPTEVKTQTLRELNQGLAPAVAASSSNQCQLGTQQGTCICVFSGQNGQERIWQFVKIPLHLNEQIWLLLATDVTEKQQLASELAAKNADLIQLNRLKDEFLACISHELKTPLTTILGLSSLLKDQLIGELNERQARYARLIHQSGRHLMMVVNDIFDLTRMETGQLELTMQPVQIKTLCERAIHQAKALQSETRQPSTSEKPVEERPCDHGCTLFIEPGLDSFVADDLRLRQMLVHLLSNAFKFTETGGEIGMRVSHWAGWITFTVWDTGIGIPEHKQHLIFQKFQQLENPLTRQFEGTGLGLVLTRALARLHGGDVSFLSREGKGSQFTLLLPPNPPQKRAVSEQRSNPAHHQNYWNRLVLVIEAVPQFIEDLMKQLTDLGYWVVIARSGTEALEKARRLQPRAIFLNPLLPLLSGWDVLTLLKSDVATHQIPVIVTATRADKEQAFLNRADDFLSLPVQEQFLPQVLAHFCAVEPVSQFGRGMAQNLCNDTPLTILQLVSADSSAPVPDIPQTSSPSLLNYRVVEADDLEQAELLAWVWQPDVILLAEGILDPVAYLKQLSQYPNLKSLPLVTLNETTTQAANQVTGLSVFPCLIPAPERSIDALLLALKVASGMRWKPSLLVIDIAMPVPSEKHSSSLKSEWFQALIQYLQTAGFSAAIGHSWAEVLQQIRQQSVDLLLICLGDSIHPGVLAALTALGEQHELPPILILEQSQGEVRQHFYQDLEEPTTSKGSKTQDTVDSLETILGAIATKILPPSLSMAELLAEINQTLAATPKTNQLK